MFKPYLIIRETSFAFDKKIVFDCRDLCNDKAAFAEACSEVFPVDPHCPEDYPVEYSVEEYTNVSEVVPSITLTFEDGLWIWETGCRAYDFSKEAIIESIYERGYSSDYETAVIEAKNSYQEMLNGEGYM